MRTIVAVALAFALLTPGSAAVTGGVLIGVITRMSIGPQGNTNALVITVTGTYQNIPGCATTGTNTVGLISYDLSKDGPRAQAQLLMAAHFVGQSVQVFGTGVCTLYPNIEDSFYMLTDR